MPIPYLHFQNTCEEAFALYATIFNGKIESISRFTEQTGGADRAGKVMHGNVSLGKHGYISGSDQMEPVEHGKSMELLIHCDTAEEALSILNQLAGNSYETITLKPHPPPDDDGMSAIVRDPYGYDWIVTAPNRK